MKFLPIENLTFRTKLSKSEIIGRLAGNIEPERIFRFSMFSGKSSKSYEGQIKGDSFDIKRIITYRNSFLPRITGVMETDSYGMTIKVKMRMHILVIFFICFWCGGVILAGVFILTNSFDGSAFNPAALGPFGMLLFAYGLTIGGFKYESGKSKKDLQKIFEAEMIEE